MAQTANSAYMLWRQFSGQPRVSKGTEAPGYRAQAQQSTVDMRGRSVANQLADFANNATQFANQFQQKQYADADTKVQDWMKDKTIEEYRTAMKEGNVPFQDDAVAMSVLHNKAAYSSALQVESDVEEQIKSGKFRTFEEADEYRVKALNAARGGFADQFGVTVDNPAFKAGFDRDQERRRETLLRLQTDVTNKRLSQEALTVAKTDIIAPLPEVLQQFGPEGAAKFIVQQSSVMDKSGLVRTDSDRLGLISSAVESIVDSKGGADVLEHLGNSEVSFGGQNRKLRDLFGGGKFDLAIAQARQKEMQRDGQKFVTDETNYTQWLSDNNDVAAQKQVDEELKLGRGERTPGLVRAQEVLALIKRKQDREAELQRAANADAMEKTVRLRGAITTLSGVLSGTITSPISPDAEGLGLKNRDELVEAERMVVDNLPDGPQKDQAILKLSATIPNGYAYKAIKGTVDSAERDWEIMRSQINSGKTDVKVPASVERVMALSKINPEATYAVNNGKAPNFMSAVEAGTRLGVTPADVAVSEAAWKALPEKERNTRMQGLTKSIASMKIPVNSKNVELIQTFAGHYMALGLGPEQAAKQAEQDFRDQNVVYPNASGSVHKSFFQLDGSRKSFEAGNQTFNGVLEETRKGWGIDEGRAFVSYSEDDATVTIRNTMTGESRRVSKDDLRNRYEEVSKAAAAEQKAEVQQTVKKESARQKARSEVTAEDIAAAAGVGTVR